MTIPPFKLPSFLDFYTIGMLIINLSFDWSLLASMLIVKQYWQIFSMLFLLTKNLHLKEPYAYKTYFKLLIKKL